MNNLKEVNLLLKSVAASNEVILDAGGQASVMVRIPAFRISDVVAGGSDELHPAFIVGGREVPEVWVSKYQNTVIDGLPQSLPASDVTGEFTYDEAVAACRAKGPGWHLMTNAEYAAIALWCRAAGLSSHGNNHLGKSIDERVYTAIPATYDAAGARARVLSGTGPVTWSHNHEISGIYDISGNVVEHAAGARTVFGEIQLIPYNDAALPSTDLTAASNDWRAILADGSYVDPSTEGTLKYDYLSANPDREGRTEARGKDDGMEGDGRFVVRTELQNVSDRTRFGAFADMTADGTKIPEMLKALALFPYEGGGFDGGEAFLNNSADERVFNRGGAQHSKLAGGPFFFSGNGQRDRRSPAVGFRAAYIPGI